MSKWMPLTAPRCLCVPYPALVGGAPHNRALMDTMAHVLVQRKRGFGAEKCGSTKQTQTLHVCHICLH